MKPVYFEDESLKLIDQTKLPTEFIIKSYTDYREIAKAIVDMIVRGAPAIGVTAGYGMYFGAREFQSLSKAEFLEKMKEVAALLASTGPRPLTFFGLLIGCKGSSKKMMIFLRLR